MRFICWLALNKHWEMMTTIYHHLYNICEHCLSDFKPLKTATCVNAAYTLHCKYHHVCCLLIFLLMCICFNKNTATSCKINDDVLPDRRKISLLFKETWLWYAAFEIQISDETQKRNSTKTTKAQPLGTYSAEDVLLIRM